MPPHVARKVTHTGLSELALSTLVVLIVALTGLPSIAAEEAENNMPLWQIGIGAGGVRLPYYPGSDQQESYAFPVILPIYRGEFLKVDEEGVRGELFANRRWQLEVSFDFNFPVDSDEVKLREGMPDLPATLQVGPVLQYHAIAGDKLDLWYQLPVRAIVSGEDLDFTYEGLLMNPRLVFQTRFDSTLGPWRWTHSLGPMFASSDYHRFYYDVDPAFASAERPAYRSSAGYSGFRYQMTLTKMNRKHLFSMFVRYQDNGNTEYSDSPLAAEDSNLAFGFVYSYFLWNSKARVSRNPMQADP